MARLPNIFLIGCGQWGKLILRDLKTLGANVTVMARSSASRGRAQEFGADSIIERLDGMALQPDGIVIATPSDTHANVIKSISSYDVPIFVEKPLASDVNDAEEIARLGADRLFVMDKWRYHPGIERLREVANSGELGIPIGLRCMRLGWSMSHQEVDPIWNLLPHDLAICLHVLGKIPNLENTFADPLGPLSGGMIVNLTGPQETKVVLEVSAHHPKNQRIVILSCENGVVALYGGYSKQLVVRKGQPGEYGAEEEHWSLPNKMPLLLELQKFIKHIHGGPPPQSSVAEGLDIVRTIHAIRLSAEVK